MNKKEFKTYSIFPTVKNGDISTITSLIESKADLNILNNEGKSLLHYAKNEETLILLLTNGIDTTISRIPILNYFVSKDKIGFVETLFIFDVTLKNPTREDSKSGKYSMKIYYPPSKDQDTFLDSKSDIKVFLPSLEKDEMLLNAPSIFLAKSREMIRLLYNRGIDMNAYYKGYSPIDYLGNDLLLKVELMKCRSIPGPIHTLNLYSKYSDNDRAELIEALMDNKNYNYILFISDHIDKPILVTSKFISNLVRECMKTTDWSSIQFIINHYGDTQSIKNLILDSLKDNLLDKTRFNPESAFEIIGKIPKDILSYSSSYLISCLENTFVNTVTSETLLLIAIRENL